MKSKLFFLGAVSLLLASCSNELDLSDYQGGGNSELSINVVTDNFESKGLVTGSYLASGAAIGVTVLNTSGGNYDGTAYSNIKFTSSGTGTSQTWSGASTVKLSATEGYCYAYYPYSSSASTITSIPVTAGGTDYMYATKASVNDKSKTAALTMKHALSAIRFALKKGTYGGTGKVTAVSVTSSALGSSGTLNATTGAVTAANKGTAVSQTANLTLSTTVQNVDVVMVPSGTAGTITLSVTIDGKAYSTSVSSTTIAQGSCYTYTLTVNAGNLALSGVKVGDWGYNSAGAPTITAAGYTVTFAGDYEDIAFGNSVSGNTVTINAINYDGNFVKEVSASSGATLTQSVSGNTRVITLTNITSNVTVTFYGVLVLPSAIADSWEGLADGVYAVRPDFKPADVSEGNESCIGVALKNSANSQCFMIEKLEQNNSLYTAAASGTPDNYSFCWGAYQTNQSAITDYYEQGALADFNGATWSNTLVGVLTGGPNTSYATMGAVLKQFRDNKYLGKDGWYIPSLGQLYLISQNLSAINTALSAIGGTQLDGKIYWSSSEYDSDKAWYVTITISDVYYYYKNYGMHLRLILDI